MLQSIEESFYTDYFCVTVSGFLYKSQVVFFWDSEMKFVLYFFKLRFKNTLIRNLKSLYQLILLNTFERSFLFKQSDWNK